MSETTSTDRSVSFDHYSEEFAADPFPSLTELRQQCPIARTDAHGGFWVVTGYDEVRTIQHAPEQFSSSQTSIPKEFGLGDFLIPPLQLDPPDHARVKQLLSRAFLPANVAPYEEPLRSFAAGLLQTATSGESYDVADNYARQIPTGMVTYMMGTPDAVEMMCDWVDRILEQATTNPDDAIAAGMEVLGFVSALVEERRSSPGDDLISDLLHTEIDGDTLTEEEITLVCVLLVLAGIDTTQATLGAAIHHLARHPADQERLRSDPQLIDTAVEEFLRAFAPVSPARVASVDSTTCAHAFTEGDALLLSIPAANRDPAAFDRPDEVVLDRSPNRHLAFGSGIHRCLGIHFARMELRVGLNELLRGLPPFELTPGEEVVWTQGQVRGPKRLMISPITGSTT